MLPPKVIDSIFSLGENLTKNVQPKNATAKLIEQIFEKDFSLEKNNEDIRKKYYVLQKLIILLINKDEEKFKNILGKICKKMEEKKYDNVR